MALNVSLEHVDWPLRSPFRIAYDTIDTISTLEVRLSDGQHHGAGEAAGVFYRGETVDSMRHQIQGILPRLTPCHTRDALAEMLPAGGARNALDCALWDLDASRAGRPVHRMLGLGHLHDLNTFFTLGLASIDDTFAAAAAAAASGRLQIKLKLDGRDDETRVAQVRRAAPGARLIVDANQSWTVAHLRELPAALAVYGVELIEQPLPRDQDDALHDRHFEIPLAADESCETVTDLDVVARRYQVVNIKLDKAGGLTGAWRLARAASERGLGLMVGNMCGSSLAMAPAFLLAQQAHFVDLDGPLLNAEDIPNGFAYIGCRMSASGATCWGNGRPKEIRP